MQVIVTEGILYGKTHSKVKDKVSYFLRSTVVLYVLASLHLFLCKNFTLVSFLK